MILFVNPRPTRPKNRRFPLSFMAIGAALPAGSAGISSSLVWPSASATAAIASARSVDGCGRWTRAPRRRIDNTLAFVRRLKDVNPRMELITYFYTPTPQRRGTYGDVDALQGTPTTLEGWTEPEWWTG
jgi:hypothetical protein